MRLKQLAFFAVIAVSITQAYAYHKDKIFTRHYTIARPYFVKTAKADTNNPNFAVYQTSGQTFDAHNDYNDAKYYARVQLTASNGQSSIPYVVFSDTKQGPQMIQCSQCPVFEKVDDYNYRVRF